MKNFPHQYNDFLKLRETLETIHALNELGEDVSDDGVLGYELARREIYTFRSLDGLSLEQRIALEQEKPTGSQGPRTAGREMRRTLRFLGWLDQDWVLTVAGARFLETAPGSEEERSEWQRALLELTLEEDGAVSHPIRILLRLVADHEIVARRGTELALEARDDSEEEYERVSGLASLSAGDRLMQLSATAYQVANAVKILPAFAEQANLIHRSSAAAPYALTEAGRAALGEGFEARAVELRPEVRAAPRRRTAGAPRRVRAENAGRPAEADPEAWGSLSHEEQIAATRLRFERSARHQALVAAVAELVEETGVELFEDLSSFDLLRVPAEPEPITIFEVKTIESDELTQTRLAVGQLLSYEHLIVRPRWPDREVHLSAVFEAAIDEELAAFLESVGIAAFALVEAEVTPLNETAHKRSL